MSTMRRNLIASLACLVVLAGAASALRIAVPIAQPIPQRVINADTIIAGKVTGVEEKTTKAPRVKGDPQMAEYRIFTVKVESAIKGGNGLTHVKVGCLVPAPVQPIQPPQVVQPGQIRPTLVRPIRPFPIEQPPMLEKGQEVLLFARPHFSEPFYTITAKGDVVDGKEASFKADVELAKKTVTVLAEPMTSLKSKDGSERYLAASLLVTKYRTATSFPNKEEEIPAEESKLILEGLAAGNFEAPQVGYNPMAPRNIFYQLQPQNAGFVQPMNFQEEPKAIKKWLEDNAGKYRVKKFVSAAPVPAPK
jgi:hypothetical protein